MKPCIYIFRYADVDVFFFLAWIRFDPSTGLVGNSFAQFLPSDVGPLGLLLLRLLAMFRLVTLDTNVTPKGEIRVTNFTIINFVLRIIGPVHERTLVIYMLTIQVGQ